MQGLIGAWAMTWTNASARALATDVKRHATAGCIVFHLASLLETNARSKSVQLPLQQRNLGV